MRWESSSPPAATSGPAPMKQPRPEAVGERAEAPREQEQDDRRRQHREPALQRRVAADLLQEEDEEEEEDRERPRRSTNVSRLPRQKLRRRNRPSGSIGSRRARLVARGTRASSATPPPSGIDHRRARPAQPRLLDQRERRARRARPRTSRAPGRSMPPAPLAAAAPRAGSPVRISATQAATSGRLIRKSQRHDATARSSPPASGPSTSAIAPSAVQVPIAAPRSRLVEGRDDHRQRARRRAALRRRPGARAPRSARRSTGRRRTAARRRRSRATPSAKTLRSPKRSPSEPPIRISEPSVSR